MKHNEDSRVKIPAILHLIRLGYEYLSLKDTKWNKDTNIFPDIFKSSIQSINEDIDEDTAGRLLDDVSLLLDSEDLGEAFFHRLTRQSGVKLIDFENFDNNRFSVVAELTYKNKDEEFRPDIILLINGMPLVFIEVKIPNNRDGVLVEKERINRRFSNEKFRKFVNITQFMIFSNNMEYDSDSSLPIEGAFYASPSYDAPVFNFFREEEKLDLSTLLHIADDTIENFVLSDNNLNMIKRSPEFDTNKDPNTPTNRLSTSLLSRDRLKFILQYGIAYVREMSGIEKHIMRYPQMFATKAIKKTLDNDIRKGIIWHTQGSGKTALAYYNVKYLTDYFQKKSLIPKFYFIVDRIDLLEQAKREFTARGLIVHTVSSRDEFAREMSKQTSLHNLQGKQEITVVNIQKFRDDTQAIDTKSYDTKIQRVYFLDEVHRSYNPNGSFLANLTESDTNSIKIGLTGTPLLGEHKSTGSFGKYIHKYYYNASISDGYTLRLIREEIETNYKMVLQEALERIEVFKGDIGRKELYAHEQFVEPMLKYIVDDFENSKMTFGDESIGGMVICDSADQAKMMYKLFQEKYIAINQELLMQSIESVGMVAEEREVYSKKSNDKYEAKRAELILYDIGTKKERKAWIAEFKEGRIDLLFVYNMLLTGFDAKRLKKLYLGRVIKDHNLLQALTRVNRPYREFRYGFVVDFADISKEFEATNQAYLEELQEELGDEIEHYTNLFKSKEEITEEIDEIRELLFEYDTTNAELFTRQISQIESIEKMREIRKTLSNAKSLYNLIRLYGHHELLEKIDFHKLTLLYRAANDHLNLLNLKKKIEQNDTDGNILNEALEDIIFIFNKVGESELLLADELKDTLRKTREALASNFDQKDPEFITLKEELERLFKKKQLSEVSQEEMNKNIGSLNSILEKIRELNRKNNLLGDKYSGDHKYARIHKRLIERGSLSQRASQVFDALQGVKKMADEEVLKNSRLLDNESYFDSSMLRLTIGELKGRQEIDLDAETARYINNLVVKEYTNEYNGVCEW